MVALRGFHGTRRASADQIKRTKYFNFSTDDEEWLGKGIYFFDKDMKQAYYFCVKARKYSEWAILSCHIESDKLIDLHMTDHYEVFESFAAKLKNKYLRRSDGKPRKLINSVVLNAMYEAEPFDLVRAVFPVPPGYPVDRTNIIPVQFQLCVRNRECIKSIEEVVDHGY